MAAESGNVASKQPLGMHFKKMVSDCYYAQCSEIRRFV